MVENSIRLAKPEDRSAFMDLWRICFTDTDAFISWFFDNRFFPGHSVCVEIEGRIVCAMQSMPLPLWIRGRSLPGAIVVGVCTHPDFRGQHLMKEMFAFYMEQMRQKGLLAITYKPENIGTYFSLGHYPTTRTLHLSMTTGPGAGPDYPPRHYPMQETRFLNTTVSALSSRDLLQCLDLYASLAPIYSGMVDRDRELFTLKSQDYASTEGKALLCRRREGPAGSEELLGYCFYFENDSEVSGEELLAVNASALTDMIHAFHSLSAGRHLKLKIPPNFKEYPIVHLMNTPQNILGVTDIARFVEQLDLSRYECPETLRQLVIEVVDPLHPESPLLIDLMGEVSLQPPCLTIGIGYFVQLLCGYHGLYFFETQRSSEIPSGKQDAPFQIHDPVKAAMIDRILPVCECFIIDEY